MAILSSSVDTGSSEFESNARHHKKLAAELGELVEKIAVGGDQRSRERHVARGKLLPRERVERLLDPGSAFLEIGQLGGYELYDDWLPSGGIITGVLLARWPMTAKIFEPILFTKFTTCFIPVHYRHLTVH